jgi:ribonuclease HI
LDPPANGCVKINCDGSAFGCSSCGSVGLVIRGSKSKFLGAMVQNIGHASPLVSEFCACILSMEKAMELHLTNLWLETDSTII